MQLDRRSFGLGAVALLTSSVWHCSSASAQAVLPEAPVSSGTPGIAVGMNSYRNRDEADLRAEFADYVTLGVRWLRTDLYWADVQANGPGAYDWSEFDRIVDLSAEYGIQLLPVVGTTPGWAKKDQQGASTPANPESFGRFLTAAVQRYRPRGIRVWEIWNEPNLAGNWPPNPDPAAYAEILIAAHKAIKEQDPGATVILGGMAAARWTGPPFDIQHYTAPAFLEAVYKAGGGDAFDAVGYHPYSYPDAPDPDWRWNGWGMMSGPLRNVMQRHGDEKKKIWITEFGAPTNEGEGGVSEDEQAQYLRDAVKLARDSDWSGPLFWYAFRDVGGDIGDNELWFGILDENSRRKPAWDAFQESFKHNPVGGE
ncbi:cellulase family glycosylhydrolase [Paracoccus aurantiacus]|uniref:Cellulase family glycosylhydrolase n=1 Tax=Paracoccus aurantiacus TaxID=2599412 RepID=A0A5C6S1K1_9RHOB|nr:cellulase family glycosylhydrolase [Paracoccus aurantiacus]TXB67720.1 cellulase family glycosylhydrolase [Paracoccus aurantiacus]